MSSSREHNLPSAFRGWMPRAGRTDSSGDDTAATPGVRRVKGGRLVVAQENQLGPSCHLNWILSFSLIDYNQSSYPGNKLP